MANDLKEVQYVHVVMVNCFPVLGATAAVGCRVASWKHDMNDDLLRLLIGKADCFEAGIR